MGDGFEHQRAALGEVAAGVDGRTQPPFDHTERRFDLPTLAIGRQMKPLRHHTSVVARRRLGSHATDLCRDDRSTNFINILI